MTTTTYTEPTCKHGLMAYTEHNDLKFYRCLAPLDGCPEVMASEVPREPGVLETFNASEIDPRRTVTQRIDSDDVAKTEASWSKRPGTVKRTVTAKRDWANTRRRTGRGRDFINEWTRSLGQDELLSRKNGVKFAAAVLATFADEKTGTVAVSMTDWADAAGVFKGGILEARDELLGLLWIRDTGRKAGRKTVYELVIPSDC